ncbi:MAG: type II secretion system protein [Oleibacter sp.]|nr:type II secretion system protein [Thalassolituus sp.]
MKGFTLVELVTVIALMAALSGFASSLFMQGDGFATLAARDQLAATASLAQQRALANATSTSPVVLSVIQSANSWQYTIAQSGTTVVSHQLDRSGGFLSIDGSTLSNGNSIDISYDEYAMTGVTHQLVFSGTNSQALCLGATGIAYLGNCEG